MANEDEALLSDAISQLESKIYKISNDLTIPVKTRDLIKQKVVKLTQYREELEAANQDLSMLVKAVESAKFKRFPDKYFSEAAYDAVLTAGGLLSIAVAGSTRFGRKLSAGGTKKFLKGVTSGFNNSQERRERFIARCEFLNRSIDKLMPQINEAIALGDEYLANLVTLRRAVRMKQLRDFEEKFGVFFAVSLIVVPIFLTAYFSFLVGIVSFLGELLAIFCFYHFVAVPVKR